MMRFGRSGSIAQSGQVNHNTLIVSIVSIVPIGTIRAFGENVLPFLWTSHCVANSKYHTDCHE